MKLRITVQGVKYDVDVEVLDGSAPGTPGTPGTAGAAGTAGTAGAAGAAGAAAPVVGDAGGGEVHEVTSPIAGTVFDLRVKAGDQVAVNDTVLVLEAMKMESNVASPHAGTVTEVCVAVGESVTHGQVLVKVQ